MEHEHRLRTRLAPGPAVVEGEGRVGLSGGRSVGREPDGAIVLRAVDGEALARWEGTGVERIEDAVEVGEDVVVLEDERRVLRLGARGVEVREVPGARRIQVSLAGAVEVNAGGRYYEVFAAGPTEARLPRLELRALPEDGGWAAVDRDGRQWGATIPRGPREVLLSSDGRVVVTRGNSELKAYALADGRLLWSERSSGVSSVRIDEQALLVELSDRAEARELATGRVVWTLRRRKLSRGGTYGAVLEGPGGSCVIEGPSRAGCPAWDGKAHGLSAPAPGAVVASPETPAPPWPEPEPVPASSGAPVFVPPVPTTPKPGRTVEGCERWNIGVVAAEGTKVPPARDRPTLVLAGAPGDRDLNVRAGVVILGLASPLTDDTPDESVVFAEQDLAALRWISTGRSQPRVVLVLPGLPDDPRGLPDLAPGEGVLLDGQCRELVRGSVDEAVAAAHHFGATSPEAGGPKRAAPVAWTWRAPGDVVHLAALPDGALAWATAGATGVVGADGRPRWQRALGNARPFVAGDTLALFAGGLLRRVDPRDGKDLATPVSVEDVLGTPGGVFVVKRYAGRLSALSADALVPLWTAHAAGLGTSVDDEAVRLRFEGLSCARSPVDWRPLGCAAVSTSREPTPIRLDAEHTLVRTGDRDGGPFTVHHRGKALAWAYGWTPPAVGPGMAFSEVNAGEVVAWRW